MDTGRSPSEKVMGFFKKLGKTKRQETDSEDDASRRNAWKTCCKSATKFTLSNLGLCVLVAIYAVAGTYMFMALEQTNEKQLCIQAMNAYVPMESSMASKLWEISLSFPDDEDESLAVAAFQTQMELFRDNVLALRYDGRNCTIMGETDGPEYSFNMPGSLLFSITIFTTIGYGNIVPKTSWGRMVTIAYSVVGIPLMLLCLANLGEVMADIFRFVYSHVCCCGCCRRKKRISGKSNSADNDNDASPNAAQTPEAWKNGYDAQNTANEDFEDFDEEEEKVSVPLTVTMLVIGGYIFMGSLLFGVWEGWDWLTSAYYCFITISTIGFGDVVPGTSGFQTSADGWKMIAASLYIIFGMAIMSMAFNLIQEEIVAKFVWLGQKLGLVKKPKREDEEATPTGPRKQPTENKAAGSVIEQPRPHVPAYSQPDDAAASLFTTPGKQPATYRGATDQPGVIGASARGSESPITKRALNPAMATSSLKMPFTKHP